MNPSTIIVIKINIMNIMMMVIIIMLLSISKLDTQRLISSFTLQVLIYWKAAFPRSERLFELFWSQTKDIIHFYDHGWG